MKAAVVVLALLLAAPAHAQLGGLSKLKKRADQVQKVADLNISEKDEREIGSQVSAKLVEHFGVYQDAAVTKYVTLVGTVLAKQSSRPNLDWTFIVLDTDGVNAYAAPGGIVHITRGALGLIKSEAELAGVLGHELTHVTARHTIRAIQKNKMIQIGADEAGSSGGLAGSVLGRVSQMSYDMLFENKFDRNDEMESDKVGIELANKVGYAPSGLSAFLTHLAERNKGMTEPNGLFASHPQLTERVDRIAKLIKDEKLTSSAMVAARYTSTIKFDAKPVTEVATLDVAGAKGVVGGGGAKAQPAKDDKTGGQTAEKADDKQAEQPKKKGFGLGSLAGGLTKGKQADSTQASASAGGRMISPDRDAKGGPNKNIVRVTVTAAELEAFRKGITA